MSIDLSTATSDEIAAELANYSLNRQKLAYLIAIEEVLTIGQENWDGDKKHYEARLDFLRAGLAEVECKMRASRCGIKGCSVEFS